MADRIDALRAALRRISENSAILLAAGHGGAYAKVAADLALAADDRAEDAQDAAQMAAYDERTAEALESLQFMPDPEPTCSICGEPCILDPHFACAMEQAQRG